MQQLTGNGNIRIDHWVSRFRVFFPILKHHLLIDQPQSWTAVGILDW